jgi:long-subunit acyl-CoA synthetase (AMP-forming)
MIRAAVARTKETFVNGWVHTGDEVIIRNREVFVVDRLKVDR